MRKQLSLVGVLLSLAVPGTPALAKEAPPAAPPKAQTLDDRFIPMSAIRPGMRGYGLTVKSGTRVERFEVEVIDIIRNNLVKTDAILVRCLGEAFANHGVAQGMSGSPIYFRDRLAGALAYTWSWSKHAIGGVTPIAAMLPEGKRALEGRPTGAPPPTSLHRKRRASTGARFRPIGTPLSVSGFDDEAVAELETMFSTDGFLVGVGAPAQPAAKGLANVEAQVEPGASVVVDLMRGDYAISALGTITHVDGDIVYGYGHSFDTLGETLFPASVGYVYTVLASRNISFKLGTRVREIGALVQDRPSCIVVRKDVKAPMVPFRLKFRNAKTGREETFDFELTPNTIYFQRLAMMAIRSAFAKAEATLGPNTKRYKMTVKIAGMEPWTYEDVVAGFDGGFTRLLIGLIDRPLIHGTQRPTFESFSLDVEVEHRDRRAAIHSAVASHDEVRPGQAIQVLIGLEEKDGGKLVFEAMDLTVPADAPAGNYVISIRGGDYVPADVPNVKNIADLPKFYDAFHKSTELVALLPTSRVDVDAFGRMLRRVPLSVLPRLVRSPRGSHVETEPVELRVSKKVPYVITGKHPVTVRVIR